jgi:N-acyl-D-amino-acid deacylase
MEREPAVADGTFVGGTELRGHRDPSPGCVPRAVLTGRPRIDMNTQTVFRIGGAALVTLSLLPVLRQHALDAQAAQGFDLIIRHGTVIDGSGVARYRADVAIARGFVARIGDLAGERAAADIDATGLFVAPGFINIHSHAAPDALPTAENMLTQGVTSEIVNADGGGFVDIAQQLADTAKPGLAVNLGAYVGFNSIWSAVVGATDRRPTDDDVARMRTMIVDGLERGAWGVSAGLDYKPAYYAQVEEVARVVEPAGRWRTNFPNHDRLTPESNFSSRVGVSETLAIGAKAGLVPVVTHMKSQGHEQGKAGGLLAMMDAAAKRGTYTAADVYPYLAGQTGLGALTIPAWAQDGGRDAMLERFRDSQLRARIVKETEDAMDARFGGAAGVYLPAIKRELVDIATEQHISPGEAVVRILEQRNETGIMRFGSEADLVAILRYPASSIACDCGATLNTRQHPRAWGSFPRVLGRYVREQHVLTWEDAIRKMTALPASTIGMVDRGYLAPGMAADVAIFDPATVIDHATYEDPAVPSEGVRVVIVNGAVAVRDGKTTGAQAGRVLARTPHMPSRPMHLVATPRRLSARGTLDDGTRVTIDLSQPPGAPRAKGTFRMLDPHEAMRIDATDVGVLQTAGRWESFTAMVRMAAGDAQAATVILEHTDPFTAGSPRTLTVALQGQTATTRVLK